jgi:GT2 family glycosyltransferase
VPTGSKVWQALGGFDEEFWMYLEDVDFGFRARLAGWDAVFAPAGRTFYHHLSASGGDVLASYYVGRNTLWLDRQKHAALAAAAQRPV